MKRDFFLSNAATVSQGNDKNHSFIKVSDIMFLCKKKRQQIFKMFSWNKDFGNHLLSSSFRTKSQQTIGKDQSHH